MHQLTRMDLKKKAILERIQRHEDALTKAHEYLETGAHSDWHGFRALFAQKVKDGRVIPPHRDWIKNVFIPNCEKAIHGKKRPRQELELLLFLALLRVPFVQLTNDCLDRASYGFEAPLSAAANRAGIISCNHIVVPICPFRSRR